LRGPVAWFTFPGPRFRFGARAGSWNHSHLSFKGNRVQRYLDDGLITYDPLCPVIPISDPQRFLRSIIALVEYLDSPTYGHDRSVLMFEEILLQLHEQREHANPVHPSAERIRELIDEVSDAPEISVDFKEAASELYMSYTHFRRLFTQLAGYSPQQLIVRKRIAKACKLLREEHYEIKDIAATLGYPDVYHFNKQFKQHTGLPPGQYRTRSRTV
jgi:AraC-like DNA-binding protein